MYTTVTMIGTKTGVAFRRMWEELVATQSAPDQLKQPWHTRGLGASSSGASATSTLRATIAIPNSLVRRGKFMCKRSEIEEMGGSHP